MNFKERAELRTDALKKMLKELESERDCLLDEVAEKKGKVAQIEKIISRLYETILDINKEEQTKEIITVAEIQKKKLEQEAAENKKAEREEFDKAKRGVKTPKPKRRSRN